MARRWLSRRRANSPPGGRTIPEPLTTFLSAEESVSAAVKWLRLGVETMGALVIGLGVVIGVVAFVRAALHGRPNAYTDVRLTMARYLAVALEFQLGADILSTAIAPSWTQIGQLGAIAVIRTGLNYFLTREMEDEAARLEPAMPPDGKGATPRPSR